MANQNVSLSERSWNRVLAALEKSWEEARPPLDSVEVDKLAQEIRSQLGKPQLEEVSE